MVEPEIPEGVHITHKMGVVFNIRTNTFCDVCTVCHECFCQSPSALLTPCDDISWVFDLADK